MPTTRPSRSQTFDPKKKVQQQQKPTSKVELSELSFEFTQ
jgi:hypothetical protein